MKTFVALIMLTLFSISPAIADQITPLGDVKRGSMIMVQGNVEKILDTDEFRLVDQTGSIRVYVGPNWVPAQVGETVSVFGYVDDGIGPMELYAQKLTKADGSVVQFDLRYD